jgi:hypothetical protein
MKGLIVFALLITGCAREEKVVYQYPNLPVITKPELPKLEKFEVYSLNDPRSEAGVDLNNLENLFLNLKMLEIHIIELNNIVDLVNKQRLEWNSGKDQVD